MCFRRMPYCAIGAAVLIVMAAGCGGDDDPVSPPDNPPGTLPAGFVALDPGIFAMGSPGDEPLRDDGETLHWVSLTAPAALLAMEMTNDGYAALANRALRQGWAVIDGDHLRDALDGSSDSLLRIDDSYSYQRIHADGDSLAVDAGCGGLPVTAVTWYGAAAWCDWANLADGRPRVYDHGTWQPSGGDILAATGFRLPTEAEWEYACRAGTGSAYNNGSGCLSSATEAAYDGGIPQPDCPVGDPAAGPAVVAAFPANAWGFFGMHGNLSEWCHDAPATYAGGATAQDPVVDPVGTGATGRVHRGGAWTDYGAMVRSAARGQAGPANDWHTNGFRPAWQGP